MLVPMKQYYILLILFLIVLQLKTMAQLNNGGFHALFGVDADTKAGYLKYGPATGTITSDDWFSSTTASGNNIIDTSNAASYKALLQAGSNICFSKRMSVPLYSNISGRIWLDAVYTRDYIAKPTDTTTFTGGNKNGDDPANWHGVASSIPDKTDLIDVFAHMRRNGSNVHDSLWFFTGVSTLGTSGARYFDIELYKNFIGYNGTTNAFNSGGPNAGHVQWLFDASGNIIQTGDMIVAVSYSSGIPTVEVRIWISNTTYNTVTPALFNFGSSFDGSTTSFGYASILSKTGTTAFGSGIANLSGTPAADTTYATPWGSHGLASGAQWEQQYQSLQFIEIGLNLTRIGIDPALYSSVLNSGACQSIFTSVFFKSRSSPSFTSNLQDFAGPFNFLQPPVLDYTLSAPTLSCTNTTGTINVSNNTTAGYYTWSTTNGHITGSSANSAQINQPGTYVIQAAVADGCPVTRTDTVRVTTDTFPPVASFYVSTTADLAHFILHGGNVAASNYMTTFGGSQGLLFNWSGPNSFTSTVQNPVTDTAKGTYQLIITEIRNGCTDTITDFLSFAVLSQMHITLRAALTNGKVVLRWNTPNNTQPVAFDIEKSTGGTTFIKTGSVATQTGNNTGFSFSDFNVAAGTATYRIKMIAATGQYFYSNVVTVEQPATPAIYLAENNLLGKPRLIVNTYTAGKAMVVVHDALGASTFSKNMILQPGQNTIALPAGEHYNKKMHVVSLYIDNQLRFTQQALF